MKKTHSLIYGRGNEMYKNNVTNVLIHNELVLSR